MREGSAVAQINSSGQSVPHACVICAPTIELALSEAEKLAAAAVCSGVGARPCGKCRDCRKAAEHVHPDIITVSRLLDDKGRPKREIGVDQMRDVIADAQVLPNEAARKVYIIDRAETMNAAAQNAALKLLEEPPAGAVFLLCTTNAMQLLPTVRSRCAEVICQGLVRCKRGYGRPRRCRFYRLRALSRCGYALLPAEGARHGSRGADGASRIIG